MKSKLIAWLIALTIGALTTSCGVQNDASFSARAGQCADGTTNAPYCMAIKLENNSGGQNWINSTNFAFDSLTISVSNPAKNLNYPVTSGSAMDPNGCINSSIKPGKSCTFYVQLTGESIPVGSSQPITITADYKIDNNLFGGGAKDFSSSYTLYQKPNLAVSNSNGLVINYSQTGLQTSYSAESGGSVPINANANDNYYGFLYLTSNSGLYLAGNSAFAYNKAESLSNINNIVINGNLAYPISGNNIFNSSIKPISKIYWSNFATAANVKNNTAISVLGRIVVASASNVFVCASSSSSGGGCTPEGSVISGIQNLQYTILGSSNSGSAVGAPLTGIIVGTLNGLFVESGTLGNQANQWLPVYENNNPITSNIISLVADKVGNIYAADSAGNIFKLAFNGGNSASLQTTLSVGSTGSISSMVYDNAGSTLYVITDTGNLYGCVNNGTILDCGTSPVATNIFSGTAFGMNIITSLYTGTI